MVGSFHEESLVLLLDSPLHATSCFNFVQCRRKNVLVLRRSNKRPISSKKDASSSGSSSMSCPDKGTNEVEGTLTTISSAAEVLVFSAVDCAHELINGESGIKGVASKILQN